MITPLIIPRINWSGISNNLRGVDASPLKLKEYAQFIAALGEYRQGKEIPPRQTLQTPGDLLDHLHFSFLISGSKEFFFRLLELTTLSVIYTKEEAIVSGTLTQWRRAVINCLEVVYKPTIEMREIFNECMRFFDILGLQTIFYNYHKKGLKDGTFLLEYKI